MGSSGGEGGSAFTYSNLKEKREKMERAAYYDKNEPEFLEVSKNDNAH